MSATDSTNQVIEAARERALSALEALRVEAQRQGFDPAPYLRARFPSLVRIHLVQALIDQGMSKTPGEIADILEAGEAQILAEIFGVRTPTRHYLTVGRLQKLLEDLPDCTPVFYHRIEDQYFDELHWDTVNLHSGDEIMGDLACVAAFGAYVATDEEGKKTLALTAHY